MNQVRIELTTLPQLFIGVEPNGQLSHFTIIVYWFILKWKLPTLPIDRGLPTRMHTGQFQFRYRNCSLNEPRWTLRLIYGRDPKGSWHNIRLNLPALVLLIGLEPTPWAAKVILPLLQCAKRQVLIVFHFLLNTLRCLTNLDYSRILMERQVGLEPTSNPMNIMYYSRPRSMQISTT